MVYDESTNPSNGWRAPEDFEDPLHDLEPGEDNPLDFSIYNPLHHAYPMIANTPDGKIEIMVQFQIIRGKANLPIDLINEAEALQVPMSIEDVPVSESGERFEIPDDIFDEEQTPDEIVAESALIDELTQDETYYLVPTIVRARWLIGPETENILGTEGGDLISAEETAELVPPASLLALIRDYRDKVAADPEAPVALLDLLDHFVEKNIADDPERLDAFEDFEGDDPDSPFPGEFED